MESLKVISRSKIPFLLISNCPGPCFAFINNTVEEIHNNDKIEFNMYEKEYLILKSSEV